MSSDPGTTVPPGIRAVLFDRDGTLVHDVPYNGDPDQVVAVDGAVEAVSRLRAAGLLVGVVSNQSGVARGLITVTDVEAVNRRVDELVGRMDTWQYCPHGPADGCDCRKPAPGLVLRAAGALGVRPAECVVIGDSGTDVRAAAAAGATGILVPTPATAQDDSVPAQLIAADLAEAVALVLAARA